MMNNLTIERMNNRSTLPTNNNVLVVLDRHLEDLDILFDALLPDAIGYLIEQNEDAIDKITTLLAQTGAKKLAIVAHSAAGIVEIGSNPLDIQQLATRFALLREWCVEEILLYSCEVAKSDRGQQFIDQLRKVTGARIAAYAIEIGAISSGKNWELVADTGEVTVNSVFNSEIIAEYKGVLKAGYLDPNFGVSGKVITDFNGNADFAKEVFSQADGKIIVAGTTNKLILAGTVDNTRTTTPNRSE